MLHYTQNKEPMNTDTINESLVKLHAEAGFIHSKHNHWGLPIVDLDGYEYAVASSDEEVTEACKEYIKETIWAFNATFLEHHMPLKADAIDRLRGDACEDSNEGLLALVRDLDELVDDAVAHDGAGHFLACYDGHEVELGKFSAFRIN